GQLEETRSGKNRPLCRIQQHRPGRQSRRACQMGKAVVSERGGIDCGKKRPCRPRRLEPETPARFKGVNDTHDATWRETGFLQPQAVIRTCLSVSTRWIPKDLA